MKWQALDNPKTLRLQELLGMTYRETIGVLELFFHFVAKHAPDGAVGKFRPSAIADAVDWPADRDPDDLIDALLSCGRDGRPGYLERHKTHELIVHDWRDHATNTLKRYVSRGTIKFVEPDPPDDPPKRKTKPKKRPASAKRAAPSRRDPHADAFKAAFDETFPDPYNCIQGDFVQLAAWRKNHPDITPERFVEVAKAHWARGKYIPGASLTIRGMCADWPKLTAWVATAGDNKQEVTDDEYENGF